MYVVTDYVYLQCLSVQKLKELLFYWALDMKESIVSNSTVVATKARALPGLLTALLE